MATDSLRGRGATGMPLRAVVDETKASFKTTELWTMLGLVGAILIASAISDSLDDVRAWTLVAAIGIGYMLSRGLAKSGSTYRGGEDLLAGGNPVRGVTESDSLDDDLTSRAAGASRS